MALIISFHPGSGFAQDSLLPSKAKPVFSLNLNYNQSEGFFPYTNNSFALNTAIEYKRWMIMAGPRYAPPQDYYSNNFWAAGIYIFFQLRKNTKSFVPIIGVAKNFRFPYNKPRVGWGINFCQGFLINILDEAYFLWYFGMGRESEIQKKQLTYKGVGLTFNLGLGYRFIKS